MSPAAAVRLVSIFVFVQQAASAAADRQPAEGLIGLIRFGTRLEVTSQFLIQDGSSGFVPLRVPDGKLLTIRQVTATCTLSGAASYIWMNFWSIRSSPDTVVHHYLPMKVASRNYGAAWVSLERVEIPIRAGGRPVANFQRSTSSVSNDGCIGSWSGTFEDAGSP